MIDNFALALSHGLLLLAAWRLVRRPDLDDDSLPPPEPTTKLLIGARQRKDRPGA
jgi:hypothetical protein